MLLKMLDTISHTHTHTKTTAFPLETALKCFQNNTQTFLPTNSNVFASNDHGDDIHHKYSLLNPLLSHVYGRSFSLLVVISDILWVSNCILSCVETAIQNRIMFPKAFSACIAMMFFFFLPRSFFFCITSHVVAKAKAIFIHIFLLLLLFVIQMNKIFDIQTS